MGDVFEILGKTVAAVGGAGAIIVAFSTHLSKLWSDKFKAELTIEIEKAKAGNDRASMKDKILFDMEFEAYKEIVPLLLNLNDKVRKVRCEFSFVDGVDIKQEGVEQSFDEARELLDKVKSSYNQRCIFIKESIHYIIEEYFRISAEAMQCAMRVSLKKAYSAGVTSECDEDVYNKFDISETKLNEALHEIRLYFSMSKSL